MINKLRELYPDADLRLEHATEFQLLVAVILSAQCKDETVNEATIELFDRFGTPELLSVARFDEVYEIIRSVNLRATKARNIIECAKRYRVGMKMHELVELPGVGRKTANVVLGNKEGIAVDTHVFRVARRLGWSAGGTPEKVEVDLMLKFDRGEWGGLSHLLIAHGRAVCLPTPNCARCPLFCPSRRK